jgi:FkbM family methyltransferase
LLIPVSELVTDFNLQVTGVLHVGAHLAEESSEYLRFNWTPVIWIEAQESLAKMLKQTLDPKMNRVIEAAVLDEDNIKLPLHISSNSQSTSLLEFGTHIKNYPNIEITNQVFVSTKRLDSLIEKSEMPNFINLDIQGVELKALQGLGNLLDEVKYLYTEVNRLEVYKNCTLIKELDNFLKSKGFKRIATRWHWIEGWGDALYVRNNYPPRSFMDKYKSYKKLVFFYKPQYKKFLRELIKNPKKLVGL